MKTVVTNVAGVKGCEELFTQTGQDTGFSNFRFLDGFLRQRNIDPHIHSLIRIFSLARKLGYRGLLIDRIPCEESSFLTEENAVLATKNIGYSHSDVFKFSFFKEDNVSRINADSFLGYAVLKIDRDSHNNPLCQHIFEAVITPPRVASKNNFLHCQRCYRTVNTLGENFDVIGALYAQQNRYSFVCAHVALRTALSCLLPAGDITYSEIARHTGKREGLNPEDIEKVYNGLGIQYDKITFDPCPNNIACPSQPKPQFMQDMYGFTESDCPVLLGFELADKRRHIVPVLGHTFNEDSWVPPSNRGYFQSANFRFFSSEQWLSSHLMHDDNFGPYYCLPRQFLTSENFRVLYGLRAYP